MGRRHARLVSLSVLAVAACVATASAADWGAWERYMAAAQRAIEQGRVASAEDWLLAAVREAEQQNRADPRLARSLTTLADVYLQQGRQRDADVIARRLAALGTAQPMARSSDDVFVALDEYARWLRELRREHDALLVEHRARRLREVRAGNSGELLFFNPVAELRGYAWLLRQHGRNAEAQNVDELAATEARQLIDRYDKLRRGFSASAPFPSAAWAQQMTGGHEALEGRLYPEAEALYADAVKTAETFPADDVRRARSLSLLAFAYRAQGKIREFDGAAQRAMSILERAAVSGHNLVEPSLTVLAVAYLRFEWDPPKALAHLQRALPILEKGLSADHPGIGLHVAGLAACQLALSQPEQARPHLQRALDIAARQYLPSHAQVAFALMRVATVYVALDDYARADALLERVVVILRRLFDPDHPEVVHALGMQRAIQRRLKQPVQSVSLTATTTVPIQIVGNTMLVRATVNGSHSALLIVDTGASVTLIRPLLLARLGLVVAADAPRERLTGLSGQTIEAPLMALAVQVGEAHIQNVQVAIADALPTDPDIDGLLGADFLNHFRVVLDKTTRRMILEPLPR
jgi:tetratricopeptide (TPR) repeat protein